MSSSAAADEESLRPETRPLEGMARYSRVMSREDLDLVRRAVRAAEARPKPDFATINEVFHPDHVFVPLLGQLEGEVFRGGRGYQQFLQEHAGHLDPGSDAAISWESDFEGAVDVGNHKVLVVSNTRYRGSASGVEVEQRTWAVMTVRDGRVSQTELYTDPAQALEAAGPSQQDAQAES
jgi:ketosteroid isomerase-like protein